MQICNNCVIIYFMFGFLLTLYLCSVFKENFRPFLFGNFQPNYTYNNELKNRRNYILPQWDNPIFQINQYYNYS